MKRTSAILIAALGVAAPPAYSQDTGADATAVPSGQLLHAAPAFAEWTISFSYAEDAKPTGTDGEAATPNKMPAIMLYLPRTIITTKTRDIIHEEVTTVGGNKSADWQVHGNCYIKYPGKAIWSAYEYNTGATGANIPVLTLPPSGFREMDLITTQNFAGRMHTKYGDCFIFVPGGKDSLHGEITRQNLDTFPAIAYVDADTRLPVMVRAKGETRQFSFAASQPSMQTLPDDLAKEIKEGDKLRAQRNAAPQREF